MDSGYSGSEEIASQKYPGGRVILQRGPEAINDQMVRQKKELGSSAKYVDCNVVQTFRRQSRIEIRTARAHSGMLVKLVIRDISIRSDKTYSICNSPVSVRSTM